MTVGLSGCSAVGEPSVLDQLRDRRQAASRTLPYDSITDLLPNTTYRMGEGPEFQFSTVVITGTFGDVTPGRAYGPEESADGLEVPFDSDDALWRTYHVEVDVDRVLAGVRPSDPVVMGLALNGSADLAGVREDLVELGTVVLFLGPSQVFEYADGVLGSAQDGELIGTLSADGSITFPVLSREDSAALANGVTVASLEAAAQTGRHSSNSTHPGRA